MGIAERGVGDPHCGRVLEPLSETLGPEFDEPLLRRLRLSGKRLVFLAETLGELAALRPLEVRRGRVTEELAGRSLATTWTYVPGWATRADVLQPTELHPWPWLVRPGTASVRSYTAWRRDHRR